MNPLDNDLKNLLRRKDPPEDFAERVMARLDTTPSRPSLAEQVSEFLRLPALRWAAVAAACVVAALSVVRYEHQQRLQAQAERAGAQATFALRITNEEINSALRRAQNVTLRALEVPKNANSEME